MMPQSARLLLVAALFATAPVMADRLASAAPASVGFAPERLQRITETLKAEIGKGTMPGAVLMIQRNDKIAYFEALGALDPEKKTPMTQGRNFPHLFDVQADHHHRRR